MSIFPSLPIHYTINEHTACWKVLASMTLFRCINQIGNQRKHGDTTLLYISDYLARISGHFIRSKFISPKG